MELPSKSDYQLAANAALAELFRARFELKFAPMHSLHEGYAVLLEEVDELKAHVWTNQRKRNYVEVHKEAMQVAAMAIAIMVECTEELEGTI
jgi:hypothetical protein